MAQPLDSLDLTGKPRFHAKKVYGLASVAGFAACAGIPQEIGAPADWGQGTGAYGQRFGSAGATAVCCCAAQNRFIALVAPSLARM